MTVFEPLALLAAIFALVAAKAWMDVATVAGRHGSDAGRVNRKLKLAAAGTALVLALVALSILAPSLLGLLA